MSAHGSMGRQFEDLFHGTDSHGAVGIAREGLHPSDDHEAADGGSDGLTVAHDRRDAVDAAETHVVHLRVPRDEWHRDYQKDYEDYGWAGASSLQKTIPAKYVHKVEKL